MRKKKSSGGNAKRLAANQFGIQYAKDNYEYYKDEKDFDWKEHGKRIVTMCALCFTIETDDHNQEDVDEAVAQAMSTWTYLWGGKKQTKKKEYTCEYCIKFFETLGFTCTMDTLMECDCPRCQGMCECEEE